MWNLSIVTFRESLEVLVILIALLTYIYKINEKSLIKNIIFGSIGGVAISIVLGSIIYGTTNSLEGYSQDIFTASIKILLAAMILYYMVWIRKQKNLMNLDISKKYNLKSTSFGLILFSFLTVFRESLEVVLFTIPMLGQSPFLIVIYCLIGLLAAIIVMFIVFKTAIKLDLNIIFNVTTIFLIYIGATLFGGALSLLFPTAGAGMETAGILIFGIPTGYIYLKNTIKDYLNKKY